MRTWNLRRNDPLCLTLAADARLAKLDYANDQIWEVALDSGEPAGISIQTTYGLRARSMRIFPQFVEAHKAVSDPADFEESPVVQQFAPNYLKIRFSPFFLSPAEQLNINNKRTKLIRIYTCILLFLLYV